MAPVVLGLILLAFVLLGGNVAKQRGPATMAERKAFVDRLSPIARRVERAGGIAPNGVKVLPGIKADLGLIQLAHESDWGRSELATGAAQNLSGMTAEPGTYWRSEQRPYVEIETTEWKAGQPYKTRRPFRRYTSWEASYLDWARRIQRPDFAAVMAAAVRGDLKAFADALDQVKYATDPRYGMKLVGVASGLAGLV